VLADHETDSLIRSEDHAWTTSDVALLDEARVMLGPQPQRAPDQQLPKVDEEERWMIERMLDDIQEYEPMVGVERGWMAEKYLQDRSDLERGRSTPQERTTYGHVIVDEAQDLSPMQWRMIARRCPSRSMTILGDLAQASGPWVPSGWEEVLEALRSRREPHIAELTINYRTPAAIMDVADRVIREVAPGLARPRSVRSGDGPPRFHRVEDPSNLIDEAALIALAERKEAEGTVAVIVPSEIDQKMHERLGEDAGAVLGDLDAGIVVVDPRRAKGLEFDVVVVVEPQAVQDEAGARGLYVTLTRPTQRLVVVHSQELPKALQPV
jgi:DNA helicase IV